MFLDPPIVSTLMLFMIVNGHVRINHLHPLYMHLLLPAAQRTRVQNVTAKVQLPILR